MTPSDYKALKSIWIEVFNEVGAEKYADTFLLHYNHHSCLTHRENGKIVSMLFLIPCYWDGCAGYYVYACATLPQFREKGYMTVLLNAAFEKAQNEKGFGLVLLPAHSSLFDFYRKCGFQPFSQIAEHRFFTKNVAGNGFDCVKSYDFAMLADWRNRFYEQHFSIQFEISHVQHIQNRIVNEQGATLVFEHDGKKGYAFCLYDSLNKTVAVLEWALISNTLQEDIPQFFKGICCYFDVSELSVHSKSGLNLGCERPFSMIRLCFARQIPEHSYFNLGMD
jgi:GNAT superfamily N-acetyltransferase